jgi:hypothetical protein
MSDAVAAEKEVQSPVENVAAVEKRVVEVAVAGAVTMNGGDFQEVKNEAPQISLGLGETQNNVSLQAPTDEANSTKEQPKPADAGVTMKEDSVHVPVEAVSVTAAQEAINGDAASKNKSMTDESPAKVFDEGEAKNANESKVGVSGNNGAKENTVTDVKNGGSTKVEAIATEDPKAEPTSPTSLRKQKAAFNVDAKPFSPVTLADPAIQGALVGDTSGLSVKVGQWGNQPFVTLPHIPPAAPIGVGQVSYTVQGSTPAPAVRKEGTGAKEPLSAFAKPWSPHPEVTVVAPIPPPENEVAVHPGSWSTSTVEGKDVQTPSPMIPKEMSNNSFTHSFSIHPKGLKTVELELFNYVCLRCPLKTLYGRLSSRQPDVTMRNVVMDIPPLCVAHLIEQITKAKVTALCVNDAEGTHYDIWLDKPNMAPVLVESISGCVWTCPMHHGYAVLGKGEEGKKYIRNYVERLRDSRPEGSNVYEVALVEVKEH